MIFSKFCDSFCILDCCQECGPQVITHQPHRRRENRPRPLQGHCLVQMHTNHRRKRARHCLGYSNNFRHLLRYHSALGIVKGQIMAPALTPQPALVATPSILLFICPSLIGMENGPRMGGILSWVCSVTKFPHYLKPRRDLSFVILDPCRCAPGRGYASLTVTAPQFRIG